MVHRKVFYDILSTSIRKTVSTRNVAETKYLSVANKDDNDIIIILIHFNLFIKVLDSSNKSNYS